MGNIKYWQQFARAKTSVPRYHSGPIQQQQANPSTSGSGHFDNNLSANFVGAVFPLRHAPLSSTLNFNIFREAKILFRLTVGRSLLHFQPTVWGIVKSITSARRYFALQWNFTDLSDGWTCEIATVLCWSVSGRAT